MGLIADRMKMVIARVGESVAFTKLNGSAGTYSVSGVVSLLDGSTEGIFLDDVESMGVTRPGLTLRVAGDANVIVDDTFERPSGTSYTCLKVAPIVVAGETVLKLAVFSV